MTGIHRERPGADELATATGEPAIPLGDDIWMSPGVSNSYVLATDDGRVIINAGLVFEGPLRQRAYADLPGPTRAIIVTQGHADHWGAANAFMEVGTELVMHANYRYWRDDTTRLTAYRSRGTSFAFKKFSDAMAEHFRSIDASTIDFSFLESRMQSWLSEHPQNRFALNSYSLDQYGLTVDMLEPIFAEYLATFDIELEGTQS
ncbi:hypothetical protein BH09ACT8_BH09ACT8_17010 [soil metagenome]